MIGLDTNVLVRYMAQDDPKQAALATRLIEKELSAAEPGFLSLVVLVEMCWVLKRLYSASADELITAVEDLLNTPQFHLDRRDEIVATVQYMKGGKGAKAGFVDALIAQLAEAEGCSHTVSFDKAAVRLAGMRLLE
ncbi:MAG: PIN domain-containing protein [Polaromonas sp.]